MHKILIYGAYGYTGKLIVEMAADYGFTPILAGRDSYKLRELSEETGYPNIVVSLNDPKALEEALDQVEVVIHTAGPFIYTAEPMIKACLHTNTHYIDITGEIDAFALTQTYDQAAREAGIMLLPGAGFDVVPTDCLALHLKKALPDASHLQLAFASVGGGVSHGTARTMAENLGNDSKVRQEGEMVSVPLGHKSMEVPFSDKKRLVMTIPWGDTFTAFYTTGIPNIETYISIHPKVYKRLKWQKYFNWLLRKSIVRNAAKRRIARMPAGPSSDQRMKSLSQVWGQVSNAAGQQRSARLRGPNGYTLTAMTSLLITEKILAGNFKVGYQTPAGVYGEGLILEIEGVEMEEAY